MIEGGIVVPAFDTWGMREVLDRLGAELEKCAAPRTSALSEAELISGLDRACLIERELADLRSRMGRVVAAPGLRVERPAATSLLQWLKSALAAWPAPGGRSGARRAERPPGSAKLRQAAGDSGGGP